jgi:hypothetical protein
MNVPYFVTSLTLKLIRKSLEQKTGYDVLSCDPSKKIVNIRIPCMFILGDSDELVRYSLFKDMFDSCPSDRKKLQIEQNADHANPRTNKCIRNCFEFLGEKFENSVEKVTYDSFWEKTFNVGNQTKELLMDLTGYDFLPSGNIFPGRVEPVIDDKKIFGEDCDFKKPKPKAKSLKNILNLNVNRKMISKRIKSNVIQNN